MRKKFFLVALILFLLTLSGCNIKSFFTTTEWKTGTKATSLTTNNNGSGEDASSNKTSSNTTSHIHQIVYQIVEDANCTEDGYAKTFCPVCGETFEDHITIAAKGHLWDEIIGSEPTCTDAGFTAHSTCERCGLTVNAQVLPALGHNYSFSHRIVPEDDNYISHSYAVYTCDRCYGSYRSLLQTNYKAAYGYKSLSILSNSEAYLAFYEWLYSEASAFRLNYTDFEGVEPSYDGYEIARKNIAQMGLSIEEAAAVYHTFLFDCPEFYYLKSGYVALGPQGQPAETFVMQVDAAFKLSSYREECQNTVKKMCEDFTAEYSHTNDKLTLIKNIHDFIIKRVNYGYEEDGTTPLDDAEAHCIIGVSASGNGKASAVCEAYSKTFLYFARMYDVDAIIVHGAGHAWNMVKYNGKWYGLDVTWDDQPEHNNGIYYGYFMKNETDFNDADAKGGHTPYEYYITNGLRYQFPIPPFASTSYTINALGKVVLDD